jgi:hypothetical protein
METGKRKIIKKDLRQHKQGSPCWHYIFTPFFLKIIICPIVQTATITKANHQAKAMQKTLTPIKTTHLKNLTRNVPTLSTERMSQKAIMAIQPGHLTRAVRKHRAAAWRIDIQEVKEISKAVSKRNGFVIKKR